MAATDAEPDSIFYPVKRAMEEAKTLMTVGALEKAELETRHARARLNEISDMLKAGKPGYVTGLLDTHDRHIDAARRHIAEAAEEGADIMDAEAMLAAVENRHDIMLVKYAEESPKEVLAAVAAAHRNVDYRNTNIADGRAGYTDSGDGVEYGGDLYPGADTDPTQAPSSQDETPASAATGSTTAPAPGSAGPVEATPGRSGIPPVVVIPQDTDSGNAQSDEGGASHEGQGGGGYRGDNVGGNGNRGNHYGQTGQAAGQGRIR
jgi:hypothetical protein